MILVDYVSPRQDEGIQSVCLTKLSDPKGLGGIFAPNS